MHMAWADSCHPTKASLLSCHVSQAHPRPQAGTDLEHSSLLPRRGLLLASATAVETFLLGRVVSLAPPLYCPVLSFGESSLALSQPPFMTAGYGASAPTSPLPDLVGRQNLIYSSWQPKKSDTAVVPSSFCLPHTDSQFHLGAFP